MSLVVIVIVAIPVLAGIAFAVVVEGTYAALLMCESDEERAALLSTLPRLARWAFEVTW
ncbi:MAG: hypothetical protein JWM87_764 [Candidatus Eremiobacteraeota bacterium]|nr:hypothetical protein [Candidatus Eremiobacteraeota bacterium]